MGFMYIGTCEIKLHGTSVIALKEVEALPKIPVNM